jgi:two-component system CheB/CheR fusion protein
LGTWLNTVMSDLQSEESFDPENQEETCGVEESPAVSGITIVAVGASAGGLEAFSEMLRALPTDTGMAFVLVQHLDPNHESILAELLSSRTTMPVCLIQDQVKVKSNQVYVIPPDKTMVVDGEKLTLTARGDPPNYKPIDIFFTSVAKVRGAGSIGVVLSGTASDGTLGLEAIKAAGGVTFAQDPTAKFDSMPRSAIAAGVVDFVLPPNRIAAELAAMARHPYYVKREQFVSQQNGPALQKILTLLRTRVGVDFTQYKQPTVQRRLVRRMALLQVEQLDRYYSVLQNDIGELEALFHDLLINVTEFFRDPQVFQTLKEQVFPFLVKDRRSEKSLRIWVPGCSTGEEIYSIAICLAEYLTEHGLEYTALLFGTDLSDRVIEKARAGLYNNAAVSAISTERVRRFFVKPETGGYQIARSIREMCIFSRHNVVKDPPLSRMDLISCRNLLIYLNPQLQRRVISTFGYALQPRGCLVLGSSETLGNMADLFEPVSGERRIFCRKPHGGIVPSELTPMPPERDGQATPYSPTEERALAKPARPSGMEQYVDKLLLGQYGPPGLVIDARDQILEMRGDVAPFLNATPLHLPVDVFMTMRDELRSSVREALGRAKTEQKASRLSDVTWRDGRATKLMDLSVMPIVAPDLQEAYVVLFHERSRPKRRGGGKGAPATLKADVVLLERELSSTRQYLQAIIEELRSTNEEAQSANEELQSTNEELQTAKEELQSSNEELNTMNAEMQSRNMDLALLNDDLTNLLSSMNMPIVMMGRDLRIRRFTPLAETVLHLIPADVGRPISDLQPRIRVPNLEQLLRHVLDSLVPYEQEVQDREGRWYLLVIRPYRTADYRIEGAVLQLLNIGELKRSLEEARHARDYSEAIIDTIGEPLLVLERDLTVRTANRAFYRQFRSGREETLGRNVYEIGTGQLRQPRLTEALQELQTRGQTRGNMVNDLEVEMEIDHTGPRILMVNARMIEGLDDERLILLAFQDVTAQKQAAEARYRRIFETSRDGIVIVDADSGEISDVNPYATQMSGFGRERLIGRTFWESPILCNVPQGEAALSRLREQSVVRYPDVSIEAADGRKLEVEVVGITYTEAHRRVIQFNLRDLTDRRKFERELQQTAKLESVGLLAGGIAHDFNNLLTGVLGNASLAYSRTPPGHPHRTLLREIQHSAERAALLTKQMLAYAGKGHLMKERITLADFIPEILPLVRVSIPKTINLVLKLAETTPDIDADQAQLQQLCMNLIINAAEAIGEGGDGKIEICTSLRSLGAEDLAVDYSADDLIPGDYALLEVIDTGSGMDEATRSKIFDPFFTTKFTGRGLGLAAAQGIVKQHGGAIHVFSAPGKGSTFHILLPAGRLPRRGPAKGRAIRPVPRLGTILLVDDEANVRNVAQKSLQDFGFTVVTAENGKQGLQLFHENPEKFRLVLLDLTMPEMGGEKTFDAIRKIRQEVPVVLLSGYDEAEMSRRMGGKSVQGFVQKPFTSDWLVESVLDALSN